MTVDGPGRYGISFNGRTQVTGAHFFGGRSDVKRYVVQAVKTLNREHAEMIRSGSTFRTARLRKPRYYKYFDGSIEPKYWFVETTPYGYSNFNNDEITALNVAKHGGTPMK